MSHSSTLAQAFDPPRATAGGIVSPAPSVGVIVGRFQVDEIHHGHVLLMQYVQQHHRSVLVLLGVRRSPVSNLNPLSYHIREQMLRKYLPEAVIIPVHDTFSDTTWSRQVDALIETAFPNRDAILYAGRDGFLPHYKGRFQTQEMHLGGSESGTLVRQEIAQQVRNSPDFRAGVIYAVANLGSRIYPTVDIAVYRTIRGPASPGIEILLGRKPDEKGWRLPGGFVGPEDIGLEHAARRELREETGLTCEGQLEYVGSFAIDDWRNRDTDLRILTTLFAAPFTYGPAQGGDDLPEVEWHLLSRLPDIIPDHQPLIKAVQAHLNKELSA